jgi:hypothetical protein
VTLELRVQLSARVHLSWHFICVPEGSILDSLISPLARTNVYYNGLISALESIISQKDVHIRSLQEKLQDLGGNYFPRKNKDSLEKFDPGEWRRGKRGALEGKESGWDVFERWGDVIGDEEREDWEAVVGGLTGWDNRSEKVCFRDDGGLIIGREETAGGRRGRCMFLNCVRG